MNRPRLPDKFCSDIVAVIDQSIKDLASSNLVCLPGVGVSFLLRHLADVLPYHFIYLNTYELSEMTKEALLALLASKIDAKSPNLGDIHSKLGNISREYSRVVIVINRLDRLEGQLNRDLFDNIRFLRDADRQKIVFLSVTSQPIVEKYPQAIQDSYSMYTKVIFIPTYSETDFRAILKIDGSSLASQKDISLSGGHHALHHILEHCQNLDLPLADPMVELVIASIWSSLSSKQQEVIKQIAKGKKTFTSSFHVYDLGIVDARGDFFSPLFKQFVVKNLKASLPKKEELLLKLLIRHKGKILTREQIADYVWGKHFVVGNWAIDSLVYRLRKDLCATSAYTIKSIKKTGFILF